MKKAEFWIKELQLKPHPEGGFFKEIYRSETKLLKKGLPPRFSGNRNAITSIYYLLKSKDISKFHRLKSDEIWHYYTGSPITIHTLTDTGTYQKITLGSDMDKNMVFQCAIRHDQWFGATVDDPSSFTLVGCSVAPGFDFNDFELANKLDLIKQYPSHSDIINRLT
jgi:predicted cupin superfamily sugar epimerase